MFKRETRSLGELNMSGIDKIVLDGRLYSVTQVKVFIEKTDNPDIVKLVAKKKFFVKKGEQYVGEQRVATSSEEPENPEA